MDDDQALDGEGVGAGGDGAAVRPPSSGAGATPTVIASASEAIHPHGITKDGLLRRYAPLRKRFAFVAGNDGAKT